MTMGSTEGCPNHARLCQASPEHFPAIAAFVLSMWYCPFRQAGGPPLPLVPPCNRQRPFFVAGDRQDFRLLRQRTIHPQVDGQGVIMLLCRHAIRS
jgi:hypothetical protein